MVDYLNGISLIGLCGILFAVVVLARIIRATSGGLFWTLQGLFAAILVTIMVATFLSFSGSAGDLAVTMGFLAGIGAFVMRPKRSRYIRREVRRQVIARALKGEAFNPKRRHIDHIWPHSRGGSNSADNLQVVERQANLKKGKKLPLLRDLFR